MLELLPNSTQRYCHQQPLGQDIFYTRGNMYWNKKERKKGIIPRACFCQENYAPVLHVVHVVPTVSYKLWIKSGMELDLQCDLSTRRRVIFRIRVTSATVQFILNY